MHGRPDVIEAEAQHEFEDFVVGFGADVIELGVEGFGGPGVEAPVFVIDENAAVFDGGRALLIRAGLDEEGVLVNHRNVRPKMPG